MKISQIITESHVTCPHCGGPAYSDPMLAEKKDACYHKVKASAKVWPSAYASGRLVQCRKKGASNYGNKSEGVVEEGSENKYSNLSNRGVNRGIKRAGDDFNRMLDLDQAESPHYKTQHQQDTKQRLKTKPMAGPKGVLPEQDVAEGLSEEFDLIESIIEGIAAQNGVDAEAVWADLESLTEDELYAFAVTSQLNEDWQKANKRDRTSGMSQKAVNAYRRENPGSKLQTAVTTKPSKLKKGSKASKRRKSYCSRSRGQMKMHSISCAKTPDKAICKARRRWNC
jgi:hypothetical protein